MPSSVAQRRSKAAPTSSRLVGLEHHVVQHLRQVEGRPSQCDGVMACVAVVEAHLERDALGDLRLEPVRLAEAEAVGQEGGRLLEGRRGQHDVAESHLVGQESPRDQRRRERGRCVGQAEDDLDVGPPGRRGPGQPGHRATTRLRRRPPPTSRPVARRRANVASKASASTASNPTATASLAGPASTMSRCARPSLRQVERARRGRLAGDEADHVAQDRGEAVGLGQFEHQVAEFELMVHVGSCLVTQRSPSLRAGKRRSVLARSAAMSDPGGSPTSANRSTAMAAANSGVKG